MEDGQRDGGEGEVGFVEEDVRGERAGARREEEGQFGLGHGGELSVSGRVSGRMRVVCWSGGVLEAQDRRGLEWFC